MKNLDLDIASDKRAEDSEFSARSRHIASENCLKIDKAVEYMAQNLDRPVQISELAGVANFSLSHFFSLFKQQKGLSPIDYFTRMRMWRACELLELTTARIKEVAVALGYEDAFYFSRVFKSRLAVAPMHYRNLGQELRLKIRERLKPETKSALHVATRVSSLPGEGPVGIGVNMTARYQRTY